MLRELPSPLDLPALGPSAVGDALGITEQTLKVWRSRKVGPPYYRIGRRILYRPQDVQSFIESRRIEPNTRSTAGEAIRGVSSNRSKSHCAAGLKEAMAENGTGTGSAAGPNGLRALRELWLRAEKVA
jgi:hypothetical protein